MNPYLGLCHIVCTSVSHSTETACYTHQLTHTGPAMLQRVHTEHLQGTVCVCVSTTIHTNTAPHHNTPRHATAQRYNNPRPAPYTHTPAGLRVCYLFISSRCRRVERSSSLLICLWQWLQKKSSASACSSACRLAGTSPPLSRARASAHTHATPRAGGQEGQ